MNMLEAIEQQARAKDAEIERLHEIMRQDTAERNGYLDEIERLQRACVGAIRFLGLVKDPGAHQAEVLLRAALAGKGEKK